MTTMIIDRAVVEQALEALEGVYGDSCDAIHALRAALAQEPQQAEPLNLSDRAVQKRLAAQWGYVPAERAEPAQKFKPTPLTQEQMDAPLKAEPAQEPVAGVVLNDEGRAALVEHGTEDWHCALRNARRLYTAPPRRTMVPLTEEEIERIGMTHQSLRQVARAVEKASWEKNHG